MSVVAGRPVFRQAKVGKFRVELLHRSKQGETGCEIQKLTLLQDRISGTHQVEKYVRRLHVTVDDLALVVQIR